MSETPGSDRSDADVVDPSRRTWLAAERTWLAWWRTGVGSAAVALAVGRIVPDVSGGARWPLKLLGVGYGVLAIAVLLSGGVRQNRVTAALRQGSHAPLSSSLVMWLTGAAVALAVATLAVILLSF